jgi:hypothetical protein
MSASGVTSDIAPFGASKVETMIDFVHEPPGLSRRKQGFETPTGRHEIENWGVLWPENSLAILSSTPMLPRIVGELQRRMPPCCSSQFLTSENPLSEANGSQCGDESRKSGCCMSFV